MDLADLLKPGALFRARERDYRLEDLKKDLLLARVVDTEEEALFRLPLEDRGIRLTFLGLPYVVFREGAFLTEVFGWHKRMTGEVAVHLGLGPQGGPGRLGSSPARGAW